MSTSTPFGSYHAVRKPASASPFVIAGRSPAAPRPLHHVLILDEDPAVCAAIGGRLNREGLSVALACCTTHADAMRQSIAFDLFITELRTQAPNTIAWTTNLVAASPVPVILIANRAEQELLIEPISTSVAGFFTKPLDLVALSQLVAQLLQPATSPQH